ncbi:MAG: hypothetical protein ACXWKB_09150 [Methyloceanibacter sp.]
MLTSREQKPPQAAAPKPPEKQDEPERFERPDPSTFPELQAVKRAALFG